MKSAQVHFQTEPDRKKRWQERAAALELPLAEWIARTLDQEIERPSDELETLRRSWWVGGVEMVRYGE